MPSNSIRGSDSPALEKTAIHVHRVIAVRMRRSVTRNGHANHLGECRMGFLPGEADRQLNLSSRFLLSPVRFERAHGAAPNMPARDAAFAKSEADGCDERRRWQQEGDGAGVYCRVASAILDEE